MLVNDVWQYKKEMTLNHLLKMVFKSVFYINTRLNAAFLIQIPTAVNSFLVLNLKTTTGTHCVSFSLMLP